MLVIVYLVTALAGASIVGVVAVVQIGVACEESGRSLRSGPATRAAAMTRRIVGAHGTFRP
jgi:hypothetical protein